MSTRRETKPAPQAATALEVGEALRRLIQKAIEEGGLPVSEDSITVVEPDVSGTKIVAYFVVGTRNRFRYEISLNQRFL